MSEDDRKKSSGVVSPEGTTYQPKPLFSSETAARSGAAAVPSPQPLFGGAVTGKTADPHAIPAPKPLMANAMVRERVTVTAEELQRLFPSTSQEMYVVAVQLVACARLEAGFADQTISTWGATSLTQLTSLKAKVDKLNAEASLDGVTSDLEAATHTIAERAAAEEEKDRKGILSTLASAFTRTDPRPNSSEIIAARLARASNAMSPLHEFVDAVHALTPAYEEALASFMPARIAGQYLVFYLHEKKDETATRYAAQFDARLAQLDAAKAALNAALLIAWRTQSEVRRLEAELEELQSAVGK